MRHSKDAIRSQPFLLKSLLGSSTLITKLQAKSETASLEATSNADVLIYSPAAFAGPHLGEYFSIPSFLMQLQPDAQTKQHPSSLYSGFGKLGKVGCLLLMLQEKEGLMNFLSN